MKTVYRDVPVKFNGEVIGRGDVFVTHSPKGVEVTMDAELDSDTMASLLTRGPFDDPGPCSICGGDPLTSSPCVDAAKPLIVVDDREPKCTRCFDEGVIFDMTGREVGLCNCDAVRQVHQVDPEYAEEIRNAGL